MTDLTSQLISNTYKQVILVSSSTSNTGVSTSLKAVQTGDGTNSALKIATNAIQISGVLEASGSVSLGSNLRVSDKVCASSFYGDGSNLTGVTATIAGNISVSNATIGSNLYVGGTVTVAGATHLQAAVSVGGAAQFGSTVTVSGATQLQSTVTVVGIATFKSNVTVENEAHLKNNVSIGGTLLVAGAPTFTSKATFSNDVSVSGRLDVATSACIGGTFRAVGAATFDGDVSVSGGLVVGGTVTILGTNVQAASARVCASAYYGDGSNLTGITGGNISGDVSVSSLNVYSTVSIGGNLTASGTAIKFINAAVCASSYYGDASNLTGLTASLVSNGRIGGSLAVSAALTVGTNVNIGGTLTVAGATSLASTLSVGGAANFASTVTVVGATHLQAAVSVGGAATFASTVTVVGAANFASTVTVVGAAHLQSTASIGGAATFASTVTVVGAAHLQSTASIGGAATFASTVTVAGAAHLKSTVTVGGAANFASTVTVVGATHLQAAVSVGGAATFASTVTVVGATHLKSTVTVGGAANFASTVTVVGATHLQAAVSVGGATQLSNTLTVGVDDQGYDVKFFGDTASAYMLWDTSTDDLILGGAAQLGIGVTAPLEKLHVQGDVGVGANGADSYIYFARDGGDTLGKIGRVAAGDLAIDTQGSTDIIFKDGGAENMRITDAGLVGIGTSAPLLPLGVLGSVEIRNDEADGYIWFHDPGTRSFSIGLDQDTGDFAFGTHSNLTSGIRMTIAAGGTVNVVGALTAGGILSIDDTTESTSGTTGSIHTDGGLGVAKDGWFTGDLNVSSDGADNSSGTVEQLRLRSATTPAKFLGAGYDNTNDHAYIQAIQSGVAWKPLEIYANITDIYSSTTHKMRVNSTGVGIGTTAPTGAILHVIGAANQTIRVQNSSNTSRLSFVDSGTSADTVLFGSYDGGFQWYTASTLQMSMLSSGNVGINNSAPGEKLEVAGAINFTGGATSNAASTGKLTFESGGVYIQSRGADTSTRGKITLYQAASDGSLGISAMTITGAGLVGIGTTSPPNKLAVSGTQGQIRTDPDGISSTVIEYVTNNDNTAYINHKVDSLSHTFATSGVNKMAVTASGVNLDGALDLDVAYTSNPAISVTHTGTGSATLAIFKQSAGNTYNMAEWHNSSGTSLLNFAASGNVTNTNNSYGAISDVKLKENIADASSQWDDIKAVKVRKFSFKSESSSEADKLGVIAQELEASGMNNLVIENIDRHPDTFEDLGTTTKEVKYSVLYMKAVKALQEAMTRIEALETRITALEG